MPLGKMNSYVSVRRAKGSGVQLEIDCVGVSSNEDEENRGWGYPVRYSPDSTIRRKGWRRSAPAD